MNKDRRKYLKVLLAFSTLWSEAPKTQNGLFISKTDRLHHIFIEKVHFEHGNTIFLNEQAVSQGLVLLVEI